MKLYMFKLIDLWQISDYTLETPSKNTVLLGPDYLYT